MVHCALFKLGFDFDGAEESPTFCCWFLLLLFPGKLKGRLPAPPLEFPAVPEPPGSISGRNFGVFWSIFCQKSAKFSSLSSFFLHRDNFTTNWMSKVLFEIIIYRKYLQYTETGRKQKISFRKTKYSTVSSGVLTIFFWCELWLRILARQTGSQQFCYQTRKYVWK